MKLQTSIKPRLDGTVTFKGADGTVYVFKADETGGLVGEVVDEAAVMHLLSTGLFEPADEEGFSAALAIARAQPQDDDYDHDDDNADDFEADLGAAPVEANTSPVRRKPGRPRKV